MVRHPVPVPCRMSADPHYEVAPVSDQPKIVKDAAEALSTTRTDQERALVPIAEAIQQTIATLVTQGDRNVVEHLRGTTITVKVNSRLDRSYAVATITVKPDLTGLVTDLDAVRERPQGPTH